MSTEKSSTERSSTEKSSSAQFQWTSENSKKVVQLFNEYSKAIRTAPSLEQPTLTILCGAPGSGKSMYLIDKNLAKKDASHLENFRDNNSGTLVLDPDEFTARLGLTTVTTDPFYGKYTNDESFLTEVDEQKKPFWKPGKEGDQQRPLMYLAAKQKINFVWDAANTNFDFLHKRIFKSFEGVLKDYKKEVVVFLAHPAQIVRNLVTRKRDTNRGYPMHLLLKKIQELYSLFVYDAERLGKDEEKIMKLLESYGEDNPNKVEKFFKIAEKEIKAKANLTFGAEKLIFEKSQQPSNKFTAFTALDLIKQFNEAETHQQYFTSPKDMLRQNPSRLCTCTWTRELIANHTTLFLTRIQGIPALAAIYADLKTALDPNTLFTMQRPRLYELEENLLKIIEHYNQGAKVE